MTIADIVVMSLIGICALATLFFLIRGIQARLSRSQQPYGVAQQEIRHDMQVNFLRAGFMLVVTLILLGIYGLIPDEQTADTTSAPNSDVVTTAAATVTEDATIDTTVTSSPTSPSPSRTALSATETPAATATVEATNTSTVTKAVVNSPNGLWLREAPGGTQEVELIAHETELEILTGRQMAEELEWQQVRTPAGNEGWVAVDFLTFP
ncbi:MAG: SH3 domain-containing protein [Chloroflexota bacterium]|nr:MAG: SH3 domain-containing protein [Chloroflexota bacterium]